MMYATRTAEPQPGIFQAELSAGQAKSLRAKNWLIKMCLGFFMKQLKIAEHFNKYQIKWFLIAHNFLAHSMCDITHYGEA